MIFRSSTPFTIDRIPIFTTIDGNDNINNDKTHQSPAKLVHIALDNRFEHFANCEKHFYCFSKCLICDCRRWWRIRTMWPRMKCKIGSHGLEINLATRELTRIWRWMSSAESTQPAAHSGIVAFLWNVAAAAKRDLMQWPWIKRSRRLPFRRAALEWRRLVDTAKVICDGDETARNKSKRDTIATAAASQS